MWGGWWGGAIFGVVSPSWLWWVRATRAYQHGCEDEEHESRRRKCVDHSATVLKVGWLTNSCTLVSLQLCLLCVRGWRAEGGPVGKLRAARDALPARPFQQRRSISHPVAACAPI